MKRKRLDRERGWGFQYFPYYQMRVDCEFYHGLVSVIKLLGGETVYWQKPKAGKFAVAGGGMVWLQLVPDGKSRLITVPFIPKQNVIDGKEYPFIMTGAYVDVIERLEYDPDGVAAYVDKYLDVVFTPQGDVEVEDMDELDEAYESGDITNEQYVAALKEGIDILSELCTDIPKTVKLCSDILGYALHQIDQGLPPVNTKYQIERGTLK